MKFLDKIQKYALFFRNHLKPGGSFTGFFLFIMILFVSVVSGCRKEDPVVSNTSKNLVIQDTVINSTVTSSVDVIKYVPSQKMYVVFQNNIITAQNSNSHVVVFGSEQPTSSDHMLDSIIVSGNKIVWTGTSLTDGTEGILVGYNVNAIIRYNFLLNCPYGTPVKSSGYTYTSGGVAYNVYSTSFRVGIGVKGTNGVRLYNNTFYNTRNVGENVIGSIYINYNFDDPGQQPSTNCQIYNNVFYTKHQVPNIYCDQRSLSGLQCDYNLYWCEDGEPVFFISGNQITFSQWKAMGYDTHSVVVNPQFSDISTLVPSQALNYGKDLGSEWRLGLAVTTKWNGSAPVTTPQDAQWQVGAYVVK